MFGAATTAKGARVLKRETGIGTDTLDKLIHEWHRTDRPPLDQYRLPAGTTVIVDEAGMVGTCTLANLTRLADVNGWRVALVGDGCQLQAVGRGGMFHVLTLTGRVHGLDRIHRFTEPWEAAASLKLRRGDPRDRRHDPEVRRDVYQLLAACAVLLIAVGTVVFSALEGWSYIDAFYFSVVTTTTVGFGDLTPETDGAKLFTVLYVVSGLSIIGTFLDARLRVHASRVAKRHLH